MSFQVGERVRVIGNLPGKSGNFIGREGTVDSADVEDGATLVSLDGGGTLLFWPPELAYVEETVEETRPLVEVLRSDPDYVIDLRQFGDGDHSPLRLTAAEAYRLSAELIRAGV